VGRAMRVYVRARRQAGHVSSAGPHNPPRDHHRLPQWYLRGFADAQRRVLLARRGRARELIPVKRATVVRDFYALYGDDGQLDQALELAWGPIETVGARVARSMLAGDFPPSPDDRLEFSGFLAAQVVRGESFRLLWERMNAAHGVHPLRNFTLQTTVRDMPQLANVFLRMRWRLCRWDRPMLLTGDQPVVYWRRGTSPRFFEGIGPMTAHEVRFALDPRHMLVLTWEGAAEDERIYEPEATIAVRLNAFTARWCEHELYCRPDLEHLLPDGPVEPLPTSVDSGDADALIAHLVVLPNWREAAEVAEAKDWGDPAEGYGLRHGRGVRR
jgi:hypothetical protein